MIRSAITLIFIAALSNAISLGNQLIVAHTFGAGVHMDAYQAGAGLPLGVMGVFNIVLVYSTGPLLMNWQPDAARYPRFAALLLRCVVALWALPALCGIVAAPIIVNLLAGTLSPAAQGEAIAISRLHWVMGEVMVFTTYLLVMQMSVRRFILPALVGPLPNVGSLVGALCWGRAYGPITLVWGMLAGYLLLALVLWTQCAPLLRFSWGSHSLWGEAKRYGGQLPLVCLGLCCFAGFMPIDAFWGSRLGPAALSSLSYCRGIVIALSALLTAGPFNVVVPHLAQMWREGKRERFVADTQRALRLTLAFSVPLAALVSIGAEPGIRLLFQHGAFDARTTHRTAALLPLMLVGMCGFNCLTILSRALFARGDLKVTAALSVLVTALYFVLSGVCSMHQGVQGIALAWAVCWWVAVVPALLALRSGMSRQTRIARDPLPDGTPTRGIEGAEG